jgi:hypothetical protein
MFKSGHWVVLNGVAGLLARRKEYFDAAGTRIDERTAQEFGYDRVEVHIDFHRVHADGATALTIRNERLVADSVDDVCDAGGRALVDGLRWAYVEEIPASRVGHLTHEDLVKTFEYEHAPEVADAR